MAIDKAIDSAQLNSDLASVANAIRMKGGTSAQLAFPSDFVTAIGAIPSSGGGGDTLEIKGVQSVTLYQEQNAPKKVKISTPLITGLFLGAASNSQNPYCTLLEEVEVEANQQTVGINFYGDNFSRNEDYALKKINLNFVPISRMYSWPSATYPNRLLHFKDLHGLNFITCGGSNYQVGACSNLGALENVTVKPNTLGQLDMIDQNKNWLGFPQSSLLTDASLVSIANGLCAAHTSKLQLHATPKARCSALMGTVSQVTDSSGTYDFFTQDANGTVTLADFITTTKGWTLA